ncbi:MAG: hypothetical protein J5654_01470 [Victivallales bacterium]|nr:hypothetical protein [Victivallales bacterium]
MADNNQQRSSTSLFGQSTNAASQSVQEIMRERQEASRARRKWLLSWLLPVVIVIVLGSAGTAGLIKWKEVKKERDTKAWAEKAAKDPMRGVTVYGNEEAALKLEFQTEDMVIAPQDILTVLHRAVGIKPFKVRLDTVNLQARATDDDIPQTKTQVLINGKSEVEYLDENGERQTVLLEYPKMTIQQLISAITLAYHDTYGDDDPEHPFYINLPPPPPKLPRKIEEEIDLNVGKMNPKN